MRTLSSLLRRRPAFRQLWIGETISLVGDWLSYVAVSLLALEAGEGALALALVFAAHVLPTTLVAPIAGIVADRIDKRTLLVGTQIVMALLMVAMVAAAAERSLWAVQAILFARTSVAGFFYPAKQAAVRALVTEDELVDANAIDATTWSVAFTLGTALGGVVALGGPVLALVVDGFTFVAAAWVLSRLPSMPVEARPRERVSIHELFRALSIAQRHPGLLEAVFSKAPLAIAGGGAWVLLNLTAEDVGLWGSGALALGALQAARGVGTGVGPALSKLLVKRGYEAGRLLRISVWVAFGSMAAFTVAASERLGWAALLLTAVAWGVGGGGSWVFSAAELQRKSPLTVLGRLSSVDMLAFTLGQGAAAVAAGYAVDQTGSEGLAGWLALGLGIMAYVGLRVVLRSRSAAVHANSANVLSVHSTSA